MFSALLLFLKNPKVAVYFAAALAILLAVTMFYSYAHHNGYAEAEKDYLVKIGVINKKIDEQKADLVSANLKVDGLNSKLKTLSSEYELKYTKELQDASLQIVALKAKALRGGSSFTLAGNCSRPYPRVQQPTALASVGTQGSPTAATTSAVVPEGRCELDPETATALVSIAEDGDRAKRKVNYLVDFYSSIQAAGGCEAKDFKSIEKVSEVSGEALSLKSASSLAP
jgi:hypothetical protein